jgi:hypothetical protein
LQYVQHKVKILPPKQDATCQIWQAAEQQSGFETPRGLLCDEVLLLM